MECCRYRFRRRRVYPHGGIRDITSHNLKILNRSSDLTSGMVPKLKFLGWKYIHVTCGASSGSSYLTTARKLTIYSILYSNQNRGYLLSAKAIIQHCHMLYVRYEPQMHKIWLHSSWRFSSCRVRFRGIIVVFQTTVQTCSTNAQFFHPFTLLFLLLPSS